MRSEKDTLVSMGSSYLFPEWIYHRFLLGPNGPVVYVGLGGMWWVIGLSLSYDMHFIEGFKSGALVLQSYGSALRLYLRHGLGVSGTYGKTPAPPACPSGSSS